MTADGSMSFVHAVNDSSALGLDNPLPGTAVHINGRDFILTPSANEDSVTIFELSSTGRLSHIQTVFDHENTAFELDGATDVSAVQTAKACCLPLPESSITAFRFSTLMQMVVGILSPQLRTTRHAHLTM